MSEQSLKSVDSSPLVDLSVNGDPEVQLTCVSNLFFRSMHFKHAGDIEKGHAHVFDHVSLLTRGSARVTVNGLCRVFSAPHAIYIKKDWIHEIEALEDGTIMICVHALRDGERAEDIIDPDSHVIPPGGDGVFASKSDPNILHPMSNINKAF